ncbi:recombinase family protein [Streptomyces uncialis]|uniref:recombinase family protein n=1 Tax=Streptomyces uncialis TaxID=1048205 RepID=UPI00382AB412
MTPFELHPGQRIVAHPTYGRLRVVGALRLSKYTDASTSPEVQTDFIYEASRGVGGEIVGWANDVDVSALKTTPWERKQLRHWLDRPEEWDVLIWQRMDRAVRSMSDMADLGRFAREHGKRLIFASGPGGGRLELDFSSPISELIMMFLAFAAQLEGQTIMERNRGAAAHLQSLGRWGGGVIPYGTIPVRHTFADGNEGWWLGRDRDTTWPIIKGMVQMAISGAGYAAIEGRLIEDASITPKNHRARLATPPRPADPESRWRATTVRGILRSPALRGYQCREDGSVVRDGTGNPVRAGEALVDDETWFLLQAALDLLSHPNATPVRRKDGHPLLGVLQCREYEANMYHGWTVDRKKLRLYADALVAAVKASGLTYVHDVESETLTVDDEVRAAGVVSAVSKVARNDSEIPVLTGTAVRFRVTKLRADELTALWTSLGLDAEALTAVTAGRRKHYFWCKAEHHEEGSRAPSIDFDATLEWVDKTFRERLGHFQRTEVVVSGGVDNRPAIEELTADIESMAAQMAKLRGVALTTVATQLNGMADTLEKLKKTPYIPPQRTTVRLDRTWGEDWAAASWASRHQMLLEAGVKVYARPSDKRGQDVGERLTFEVGTHIDPEQDALDDAAYQAQL